MPRGIFPAQCQQLAPGIDRVGKTAELQIDRGKNLVAACIVGITLQMRLDLRDHDVVRLCIVVNILVFRPHPS